MLLDIFENFRKSKDKESQAKEGTLGREIKEHEKNNKAKLRKGKMANYDNTSFNFTGTKKGDCKKEEQER